MSTFERAYGIERTIAVKRLPAFRSMAEYITYPTYTHTETIASKTGPREYKTLSLEAK